MSSGVPQATISPPRSPPSGPRSMIQSAVLITSRLCSMMTMVFPPSTSLCRTSRARARDLAARARDQALLRVAAAPAALSARVAVATKSGGLVDQHFGHAREFLVYDVSRAGVALVGRRATELYCTGGEGDDDALSVALRALADCDAVLVSKIGHCPNGQLAAA